MVLERVIGSGTTNSNGQIVIPYTGVGAGKLQLKAKATVNGSIIQSEIYSILDTIYYDNATSNDHKDIWRDGSNILSRDVEYSLITSDSTYKNIWLTGSPSSTSGFIFNAPFCVEFDVVEETGRMIFSIGYQHSGQGSTTTIMDFEFNSYTNRGVGHWKIIINENSQEAILNDNTVKTGSVSCSNDIRIGMGVITANSSLKFKNFRIYYI